jgi:hypothetical protein
MPTSLLNLHEAHGISQYATAPPGLCAPVAEAGAVSLEEEAASPELEATGAHKLVMDVLTSWDANEASLSVGGASLIVPAALLVAAAVSLVEDRASASGAHVSSMVCVARQDSCRIYVSERTPGSAVGRSSLRRALPETSTCKVC